MAAKSWVMLVLISSVTWALVVVEASREGAAEGRVVWEQALVGVPMPSTVAARLSPLMPARAEEFASMVSKGTISPLNAAKLCNEGDLYCKSDITREPLVYGCIRCITNDTAVDPNLFLPNKELRLGGSFAMPNLYDPQPMKAFLPPSLAAAYEPAFSSSSQRLPQLLRSLGVREGSNMAHNMATVLATCRSAQEGHVDDRQECITSVEGMVSFVISVLGTPSSTAPSLLQVISESSHVGSEQKVEVLSVKEEKLAMSPVTCHSWVFPFAVYYCHYVEDVRVLSMRLQTLSDGQVIERSALCHRWKEVFRPKYEALGIPPGEEACHFIYASNLMFLKKTSS